MIPSDTLTTAPVTLSGNYTGTSQGSYTISLDQAESGLSYSVEGLNTKTGFVNRGLPLPIGNGLFIIFGSSGTLSTTTTWTINIPNTMASSYQANLNAYNQAQQNQTQALQQAQSQIDSAKNALDQAQTQLNQKATPPLTSDVESAKSQVESAKVTLANAENTYQNNIIRAPFDGLLATLTANVGDQASSGTAIGTLITAQQIAQISLNEVDVSKISLGEQATLTFDAVDGLTLTGKVVEIDSIGTVSQGVVTYNVKIALDSVDPRIKPSMSVNASIITLVKTDVLTVPNSAIKTDANGSYVQVLDAQGQPQDVTVTTGISNDTVTEIQSGLKDAQAVVTQTISSAQKTATSSSSSGALRIPGLTGGATGGFGGGGGGGAVFRGAATGGAAR